MGRFIAVGLLVFGAVGCHDGVKRRDSLGRPCLPDSCANPCPPEVVVKAQPAKVILEGPPPTTVAAPQAGPPAAPQAAPQAGPTFAMPQAGMGMPFGGMAMPYAGGFGVNAEVKERHRLGFVLDTIRIPIPWIRAVPVQRPAEVTIQMPMQTQQAAFMMPMGAMPMGAMGGFGAGVQMAPIPVQGMAYGTGHMVVPGPTVVGQAQQGVVVGQGATVQAGPLTPQDRARLEAAEKQVDELLKLCEELKKQKKDAADKKREDEKKDPDKK